MPLFPHVFAMKWWDQMPWSYFFECWVLSQFFHSPLSLSSKGSLVLLHFLPQGWCHLHIWGYAWYMIFLIYWWSVTLLIYWWIQIASILLLVICLLVFEDFCFYIHQWYWSVNFFLCDILVWLWYQGDDDLIECVWKYSFLYNYLEEFQNSKY